MPDYAGVYANTTVTEYLDFFARAYGLRGNARRLAVENIIEFMGIGDLRERHVESLSKGLKQRVALGRAIIHDPQLLILDEPAANLDPRARIEFRTLIRELAADGKTILLSSHILTELAEMCDIVTVIEKGKILATGTVDDILEGVRRRRILSASRRFNLAGTNLVGTNGASSGFFSSSLASRTFTKPAGASSSSLAGATTIRWRSSAGSSPPGFRCSSSPPKAPAWRICSSRSPKGGCNEHGRTPFSTGSRA